MITTLETLLPGGERDPTSLHCALYAAERERVAVFGALAILAGSEALSKEAGDDVSADIWSAASRWLERERRDLDRLIVELTVMGGVEVCRLAPDRKRRLDRELATREASTGLVDLAARYMRLAVRTARLDRLEEAGAALAAALGMPEEPSHG